MAKVTASRYTTDATNVINEVAEQIAASTNALKRVERTNINRHHQPRHY
jgi:DNA-binding FrmR family transcriptional regulator